MQQFRRQTERCKRRFDVRGDSGLRHLAQHQRRDCDAELCAREVDGQVLRRVQHALRLGPALGHQRFQAVPARGDKREFNRDEKRVHRQQGDDEQRGYPDTHCASSSGTGRNMARSMRRPSISVTWASQLPAPAD